MIIQSLCLGLGLGLGLLDSHPVLYALHIVYVVGKFGGLVQFGCVAGLAVQCDHARFVSTLVLMALVEQ
jgi:hypothetical protein